MKYRQNSKRNMCISNQAASQTTMAGSMRTVGLCLVLTLIFFLSSVRSQLIAGTREALFYELLEESRANFVIGNIKNDANISKDVTADILPQLRFTFLSPPRTAISIEEMTGVLKTNGRVDRDELCPNVVDCDVVMDIAVHSESSDYFRQIKVTVKILDMNDNTPTFAQSELSWQLLESASPGITFTIPLPSDPDTPPNGLKRVDMLTASDKFELKMIYKPGGTIDLKLELQQKLDREVKDGYEVHLAAYDGGSPPKIGYVKIRIAVLDSNDNSPVFEQSLYKVTIPESTVIDTTITRVRATDNDIGINAEIVYSFNSFTNDNFGKWFGIDAISGNIFLLAPLDFEASKEYTLGVVAKDKGPDSVPADATVIVSIEDVNDHAPEITVNTLSQANTTEASIRENADVGTFVAQVLVKDPDDGNNGRINCSLNDNAFQLVKKYEGEYQIVTTARLDREQLAQHSIALLCKDGGAEPQIGMKYLRVIVLDVNDNTPVFMQSEYRGSIDENNFIGALLLSVNATDADIEQNAQITYSLSPDVSSIFEIHPSNGRITAKTSINREEMDQIRFNAVATDQGSPPRSTTCVVVITINDVNDEPPRFLENSYMMKVTENQQLGASVGSVVATDADTQVYSAIYYTLAPPQPAAFMINHLTGAITTTQPLDRESQDEYRLVVVAADSGNPPLSSTVGVTVLVEDENDHAPQFLFPSTANFSVQVASAAHVGTVITRIQAVDQDAGANGRVSYQIQTGNDEGLFSIDPNVGVITLNLDLSAITLKIYRLQLTAYDHGVNQLSTETKLDIVVNGSIPVAGSQHQPMLAGPNFIIVVSVACATGIVTVALIIAIIMIRRQDTNRKMRKQRAALHFLTSQDSLKEIPQNVANEELNGARRKEVSFSMDSSMEAAWGATGPAGKTKPPSAWKPPPGPCDLQEGDGDSDLSTADGSTADSGRGASEEGEHNGFRAAGGVLPPQPRSILYSERTAPPQPPRAVSPPTAPVSPRRGPHHPRGDMHRGSRDLRTPTCEDVHGSRDLRPSAGGVETPPPLLPRKLHPTEPHRGHSQRSSTPCKVHGPQAPQGRSPRRHGSHPGKGGSGRRRPAAAAGEHRGDSSLDSYHSQGPLRQSSVKSGDNSTTDSFRSAPEKVAYLDGVCSNDVLV